MRRFFARSRKTKFKCKPINLPAIIYCTLANSFNSLICSDLISRGLDLPHVDNVVNYDIPSSTRAYVHRVGRTARAGKDGDAFTLVEDKEARWFWRDLVKGIRRREEGVERMAVALEDEGMGWRGAYEECLYG